MERLLTKYQVNVAQKVGKYNLQEDSQFCGGKFQEDRSRVTIITLSAKVIEFSDKRP